MNFGLGMFTKSSEYHLECSNGEALNINVQFGECRSVTF